MDNATPVVSVRQHVLLNFKISSYSLLDSCYPEPPNARQSCHPDGARPSAQPPPPGPPLDTQASRTRGPSSVTIASVCPDWLGLCLPRGRWSLRTIIPEERTPSHLAHIGQPAFFSLVYESVNNETGFPIRFEIGGLDSWWLCTDFLFGREKCLISSLSQTPAELFVRKGRH